MKILFSALDWGLGHTTRSTALIDTWVKKGYTVTIAATSKQQAIFKEYFPDLTYLPGISTPVKILKGKQQWVFWPIFSVWFLFQQRRERRQVKKFTTICQPDVVASDNRYGFYSSSIESWFITHQLTILPPSKIKWMSALVNTIVSGWIQRFDKIIVPDIAPEKLAGKLSRPHSKIRIPIEFIGPQSRLTLTREEEFPLPDKPFVLFLLSGPESQRSIFEQILIQQTSAPCFRLPYILIRGLPTVIQNEPANHFATLRLAQLKYVIQHASYIICRSGYSTLMDLHLLNKKAFLVPTPGQPEQEYLAEYWQQMFDFPFCRQEKFVLCEAIQKLVNS